MLDFIGSWGGRVESPRSGAERLLRSFSDVPDLNYVYEPWVLHELQDDGSFVPLPADVDALEQVIADAILRDDDGVPMVESGYSPSLIRLHDDTYRKYSFRVGFDGTGLKNHVHFSLDEPGAVPGIDANVVATHFRALVNAWEPDYLYVGTKKHFRAIGCKPAQICAGWLTYVKDDVPLNEETLRAHGIDFRRADGGRYIQLTGTPSVPDSDQAVIVRQALGY